MAEPTNTPKTEEKTTDNPPAPVEPQAPTAPEATSEGEPASPLAAVEAEVQAKADEGKPDPFAQSKISGAAGVTGDLVTALGNLPQIAALDGIKAAAASGYYRTVPKDELLAQLRGLPFEDETGKVQRDWLVQRAESGEFSRG